MNPDHIRVVTLEEALGHIRDPGWTTDSVKVSYQSLTFHLHVGSAKNVYAKSIWIDLVHGPTKGEFRFAREKLEAVADEMQYGIVIGAITNKAFDKNLAERGYLKPAASANRYRPPISERTAVES